MANILALQANVSEHILQAESKTQNLTLHTSSVSSYRNHISLKPDHSLLCTCSAFSFLFVFLAANQSEAAAGFSCSDNASSFLVRWAVGKPDYRCITAACWIRVWIHLFMYSCLCIFMHLWGCFKGGWGRRTHLQGERTKKL